MFKVIREWFHRYFSDPEAVLLLILLAIGFGLIFTMGTILAPVIASVIIAYLLETWIRILERLKVKRTPAFLIVFFSFLGLFLVSLFVLMPLAWKQLANLFNDLPNMLNKIQNTLFLLPEKFPQYFSQEQMKTFLSGILVDVHSWGKVILSKSLSSIPGLIAWVVYIILVPLMIFFFLKDRDKIIGWLVSYLPQQNKVLKNVWQEVDEQIGNYVRGKITEIIVVTLGTYIVFAYLGLNYSLLLATIVGFSVLIPYIGATVVTIPVALVAYLQWGPSSEFVYLLIAYLVVQALDGNVLVPLLFSEAVNLHPIAIIVAILVFGGLWGFWGIFFAIPLATLFKAVLNAWPHSTG